MSDNRKYNPFGLITKTLRELGEKIVDTDALEKIFDKFINSPSDTIKKKVLKLVVRHMWGQEKGELSKKVLKGFTVDPECPDWLKELAQKELDGRPNLKEQQHEINRA